MNAATLTRPVDVTAVEEHLARYAVSCPLCRAVDRMGVAQELCDFSGCDGGEGISVVMILCRRCGYLMPLAADRVRAAASPNLRAA